MKTMYADFNDFDGRGTLPLTCAGSVTSIETLGESLRDSEQVWLTDAEIRVMVRVYRLEDGFWEARADKWEFSHAV